MDFDLENISLIIKIDKGHNNSHVNYDDSYLFTIINTKFNI